MLGSREDGAGFVAGILLLIEDTTAIAETQDGILLLRDAGGGAALAAPAGNDFIDGSDTGRGTGRRGRRNDLLHLTGGDVTGDHGGEEDDGGDGNLEGIHEGKRKKRITKKHSHFSESVHEGRASTESGETSST